MKVAAGAIAAVVIVAAVVAMITLSKIRERKNDLAQSQVERWADQVDGQTNEAGLYVRHAGKTLPENDPWGAALVVDYSQGGVSEVVTVRSLGADGSSHTADDLVAKRQSTNLQGIGAGAKKNVEEFAERGARGMARGVVAGLKEGVKNAVSDDDEKKDGP